MDLDGWDDILVVADGADGTTADGAVYLVRGPITGDMSLSEAQARLSGIGPLVDIGQILTHGVDTNDDTWPDLLVGASSLEDTLADQGIAFLVTGPLSGELDLATEADTRFVGEGAGDMAGGAVELVDITDDGHADVIIGACHQDYDGTETGSIYIFQGMAGGWTEPIVSLGTADIRLWGAEHQDIGMDTAAVDANGDGISDLLAEGTDYSSSPLRGYGYLLQGPVVNDVDLGDLGDFVYVESQATAGRATVKGAGDMDDDGYDEILLGTCLFDNDEPDPGHVYLFSGPVSGVMVLDDADVVLAGVTADDYVGGSADAAGDVNGDGHDDLLVGASGEDTQASAAGAAYLFFGPLAPGSYTMTDADAIYYGESQSDSLGYAVAGAGDVDADGYQDLLLGAWGHDGVGNLSGAAYLVFGGETP